MGISNPLKKAAETINKKIAGFEKAKRIDIPFVGTGLKKEASKQVTTNTKQQIEEAREYFKTGKTPTPTPFQPKKEAPKPEPKTYEIDMEDTKLYCKQKEEIEKQIGTKTQVVATPEGKLILQFTTTKEPPKEIKITPSEEIEKQQKEEALKQKIEQVYEKASPSQKVGLHAHTFFSEKGFEYAWSWLPEGKKSEEIVKEKMVGAYKTPTKEYATQTIVGSLYGNPIGVIGSSTLLGGAVEEATVFVVGKVAPHVATKVPVIAKVGKVGEVIAEKVPVIAKVGEVIAEHPTETKVIIDAALVGSLVGTEIGKGVEMYKTLEDQQIPNEEIAEKIGAEISRDVFSMVGFGTGFKYGLEKTLPPQKLEIVGRRIREGTLRLVVEEEGGIPEGKIVEKMAKKAKFIEPTPAKEWMEAVKKGKIVEKTPDYIIKQYHGYEYLIYKKPTGLPTKTLTEDLVTALRGEEIDYLKLGVAKEGKYKGMEIFVRKGMAIPLEKGLPEEVVGFEPIVFKPKGNSRPILKELAEHYSSLEAEKIAKTEAEQLRAMEKATRELLGEPVKEIPTRTVKEIPTRTGELLLAPEETGFVKLEPIVSPVALEVVDPATVPTFTPEILAPILISRIGAKTEIKNPKESYKLIEETPSKDTFPEEILMPRPTEETPVTIPPGKEEIFIPRLTEKTIKDTIPPGPEEILIPQLIEETTDTIPPGPEEILTPEEIIFPPPPVTIPPPFTPPQIIFPELPKGSLGKATLQDFQAFKQLTKYEPSLLGILLGVKQKKKKKLFTGFEIRGI